MKKIFVVFVIEESGKYYAYADTIKTGENLIYYIKRAHCIICHLCESRRQADDLANRWNEEYKANDTYMYN